jgi:hypothetical protein
VCVVAVWGTLVRGPVLVCKCGDGRLIGDYAVVGILRKQFNRNSATGHAEQEKKCV